MRPVQVFATIAMMTPTEAWTEFICCDPTPALSHEPGRRPARVPADCRAVEDIYCRGTARSRRCTSPGTQISPRPRRALQYRRGSVPDLSRFQFCALPFMDMNSYFRFSFPAQFLLLGDVLCMRSWLAKHFDPQGSDAMSDDRWKWGYFYSNPDDPALIVPLRSGLGFSYNLARPSIRVLGGVIAIAIVAVLFR